MREPAVASGHGADAAGPADAARRRLADQHAAPAGAGDNEGPVAPPVVADVGDGQPPRDQGLHTDVDSSRSGPKASASSGFNAPPRRSCAGVMAMELEPRLRRRLEEEALLEPRQRDDIAPCPTHALRRREQPATANVGQDALEELGHREHPVLACVEAAWPPRRLLPSSGSRGPR